MRRQLLMIVVLVAIVTSCGGGSKNASPTAGGSAAVRTSSPSTADFFRQAARICSDGQQEVYQAIEAGLNGQYPSSFPSQEFAAFYRQTAQIGTDVITRLRQLPIPSGREAQMTAELKLMTSVVEWARAAGRAAAGSDEATYQALVQLPAVTPPAHPLLPEECGYLSLGPGAGN